MDELIINLIENKRTIAIGKRLERMMQLNRKGIFEADSICKRLSKEVSNYTKLLQEIEDLKKSHLNIYRQP